MSEDKVTEESLGKQLFEVLQTNDPDKDKKILTVCENIATATMNLPPDKLDSYKNIYKHQLSQLSLNIKDLQKLSEVINNSFPGNEYQELRDAIDNLTDELVKEANKKLQAELVDKRKNINENPKFKAVKDLLRDKGMAEQKAFTEKGDKQAGVSAGYIAQENVTNNSFILKQFYKSHADCLAITDQKQQMQALNDRGDRCARVGWF